MPGAWDAIWHPHGRGSGLTGATDEGARTASGATMLEAAEVAFAELERTASGA